MSILMREHGTNESKRGRDGREKGDMKASARSRDESSVFKFNSLQFALRHHFESASRAPIELHSEIKNSRSDDAWRLRSGASFIQSIRSFTCRIKRYQQIKPKTASHQIGN